MKKLKNLLLVLLLILPFITKGQDTIIVQTKTNYAVTKSVSLTLDSTVVTKLITINKHDTITKVIHDTIKVYVNLCDTSKPISTDTLFRGVYISGLKSIAGNLTLEDRVITNLNKYKFKATYWYSIDGANDAAVTNLFKRIKKETKVTDQGATASSASTFINTRLKWNAQHVDSADYNTFNMEQEFWNATDKVAYFNGTSVPDMQKLDVALVGLPIKNTWYVGWWNSPLGTNVADTLAKYQDFQAVHDYRTKPDFAYMKTRCDNLNSAYKKLNKIGIVRPIGSAEPNFLGPWLQQGHTLDEWFYIVYNDFKAQNYTNLIMDGYIFFTLDFIIANSTPPNMLLRGKPETADPNFKNETTKGHMQYIESDTLNVE